jgi:hypothetical protein
VVTFSAIDVEDRVRTDHPLRPIREIANAALAALSGDFTALYSGMGRPSVPPEKFAAGDAAAGLLFGALGTAVDGTDRIRPVVPLAVRSVLCRLNKIGPG